MANRKNSQLQKIYVGSTNWFTTCPNFSLKIYLEKDLIFVSTCRFQSNPLERRFVEYWQMSGGRFLVGLQDVTSSEKFIKTKLLLEEDLDIYNVKVGNVNDGETISRQFILPAT